MVGRIDRFQIVFFRAPKSPTAINTRLDDMEDFKGRDIAISDRFFLLVTVKENKSLSY